MAIGLDFETWCELDLTEVGLDNYVNHPSFRPILASVKSPLSTRVHRYNLFYTGEQRRFREWFENPYAIVWAHNAGFERAVLRASFGLTPHVVDSAVVASAMGAGRKLEAAAPQLLGIDKMEEGRHLMKKFSMGPKPPGPEDFDTKDWDLYGQYCDRDAELSFAIGTQFPDEQYGELLTADMNERGWPVDMTSVDRLLYMVEENKAEALAKFREKHDPDGKLNLSSFPQLKQWCLDRKIRARSFDKDNVAKMITRITQRLETKGPDEGLEAVLDLLQTKVALGGASVEKLPTIKRLTSTRDSRLRDSYLHLGASQTHRTTGRGVQMQNLHRLTEDLVKDFAELDDPTVRWTNEEIAANLRQLFTSSHPEGFLLVGDFSSVESRGLAYLAGEEWKLQAYREGKDLYKVMATKMNPGLAYEAVTKPQRQNGKVGELSCGYNAGGQAVRDFAEKMGTIFTLDEATKIVTDWRESCPNTVQLWRDLDDGLHRAMRSPLGDLIEVKLGNGMYVKITPQPALESIQKQHAGCRDLEIWLAHRSHTLSLRRFFRGCYLNGTTIVYHKASEKKTGNLWSDWHTNPKTKQRDRNTIYGGKLAGILTQSMCRELFFHSLNELEHLLRAVPNAQIIGQFHDEIVIDWWPSTEPGSASRAWTESVMEVAMTGCPLPGFPLAADIKHDYRYTK